jgi:3-hydroxymyristoyl/3-hydroxydecanoyl-(acyl carrier protein) dehydratase
VIEVETLAHVRGLRIPRWTDEKMRLAMVVSIAKVKFRSLVPPRIEVSTLKMQPPMVDFHGVAKVDRQTVPESQMRCVQNKADSAA